MKRLYVQYGCGLSAPKEWMNFDVSPTLRIQKIPVLGRLIKNKLNVAFPSNVIYGDIISGLPIGDETCDGIYCSHTLEHLSLMDFRRALHNTYKLLKKEGIFRCILPDLEFAAREYIKSLENGDKTASIKFMRDTLLGLEERPKGVRAFLTSSLGNSHHLWMWDHYSLQEELKNTGFTQVRICRFNDCEDEMFRYVESEDRFLNSVAIECKK